MQNRVWCFKGFTSKYSKQVSTSCTTRLSFFMWKLRFSGTSFFLRLRFFVDLTREILLTFLVADKSFFSLFSRFNQPCSNFEPKFIAGLKYTWFTTPYVDVNTVDLLETEWNFLQSICIFHQEGMTWTSNNRKATFHSCCYCMK